MGRLQIIFNNGFSKMSVFIKNFINGSYRLFQSIVMFLPFSYLRIAWCKLFIKQFGKHIYISRNLDIRSPWKGELGNNVIINKRVLLDMRGGLYIGNNVDIAQDVQIWTAEHDVSSTVHAMISSPVKIADNVWIASRAIILPGVTIGKGAVVACGAIVTKDVEPFTIVAGVPAKKISERTHDLEYTLNHKPFFE